MSFLLITGSHSLGVFVWEEENELTMIMRLGLLLSLNARKQLCDSWQPHLLCSWAQNHQAAMVVWWNPSPGLSHPILLLAEGMLWPFLFIDPRWDLDQWMNLTYFNPLDRMTELSECPFSHPSKTRWQNRMPWDELQFNTSAKAPQIVLPVLQFFALADSQSFLLAYLFLFCSPVLFFLSFPLLYSLLLPFHPISFYFPFVPLHSPLYSLPRCTSLFSLFSFLICNKTKEHRNKGIFLYWFL